MALINYFISRDATQITIPDERFYKLRKNYYPSATYILGEYPKGYAYDEYLKTAGHNSKYDLERATLEGKHVHDAINTFHKVGRVEWIKNEQPIKKNSYNDIELNFTVKEWQMINRYFNFYERFVTEFIGNEITFVSVKRGYGGTIDLIVRINGVLWLIDVKTNNAIWKTAFMQVSAYMKAYNDEAKKHKWEPVEKCGILWLKAKTRTDGTKDAIQGIGWQLLEPPKGVDHSYKLFCSTFDIWKEEHAEETPSLIIYPTVLPVVNI